jgi:hypothetical protein
MAVALLLAAVSLGGAGTPAGRHAFCSTREFFSYFQASKQSSGSAGFWERLTLSLVLASAANREPGCKNARHPTAAAL